ncbi:hypothetical protein LZZ85_03755 [Terrimonas sp. NA20]|uniref:Asl1-like glycosyl hydrolase catalytic domain-containing protein n=1 Tax=Terrimonas ginsenosidimutans TaxID=2908004 RepID=A0ABS9KM40_9BACT|nr:hypothetical protein [Terrimonas ginsenosidimutans]MCG2613376.1 hypothetical protein [Terrimonas ginsenosidimutans]
MSNHKNCFLLFRYISGLLLLLFTIEGAAQGPAPVYLRGDQEITFKWRFGYSEYPFPQDSPTAQEDAARGTFGWYDGTLWSHGYKTWDNTTIHGVQLLFRGGSPYAREIKCTSELIPYSAAGTPVSFIIPFMYTIGSEESLAFSLGVKGKEEETIVCKLRPQQQTTFTGGLFKVNFIALKITSPAGKKPIVSVSGLMHIRVYPQMLSYGARQSFVFSSNTKHMDVESGMLIGSVYKDLSKEDPYLLAAQFNIPADSASAIMAQHDDRLRQWNLNTAQIANKLMTKGTIEVSLSGKPEKRDRGELRVMAYSGNPVKDFQYGKPTSQIKEMAQSVTNALGKKFSLFRYQHHYLPWKIDNPAELDSTQLPYLTQWLEAAGMYADTVVLDLQITPIVKMYKQYSRMGQLALPPTGTPGAEWDRIRQGYLTTLRFAKKICPSLKIVQMPYELDNITNTSVHADAHYSFFKCLYEAVGEFNKTQPSTEKLKVAGLGSNNPNSRWEFINGFLSRYSKDASPLKRLDYIAWHTYLFPGNYPSMVKGFTDSLQTILKKNGLDPDIPVLVDEMGLAEPSTIEDLSDLQGAMKKEAAMASFTTALHEYYEREHGQYLPVSGAGWHFALLTYGKQNVLSTYAKGLLLRNKLGDRKIPSSATPVDNHGYGLHSIVTKEDKKISILIYCTSPSIFYSAARPLNYRDIDIILKDLPSSFRNTKLKITQWYSTPEDSAVARILSQDKYQTLPLTRGADRYEKNFTKEEINILNTIGRQTTIAASGKSSFNFRADLDAYGMRLIEIEPVE